MLTGAIKLAGFYLRLLLLFKTAIGLDFGLRGAGFEGNGIEGTTELTLATDFLARGGETTEEMDFLGSDFYLLAFSMEEMSEWMKSWSIY